MKMERLSRVDFLRFYLVITIVYGHLMQHYIFKSNVLLLDRVRPYFTFCFGYACEMLFVISGFFLTKHFDSHEYDIKTIVHFIESKYIRLAPVVMFSTFFILAFKICGWCQIGLTDILLELLFVSGTGLSGKELPFLWYISVMFWVLPFYLFLFQSTRKYFPAVAACIIFYAYSCITNSCDAGWYSKAYSSTLSIYVFRGLGGIGLGCLVGTFFSHNIVSLRIPFEKFVFSLLELLSMLFLVYGLNVKGINGSPVVFPLYFAFILLIFLSQKGYISHALDKKFFSVLNRYGYSMYVMSYPVFVLSQKFLIETAIVDIFNSPIAAITIIMSIAFLTGVVTYHLIERPGHRFLSQIIIR